MAARSRLLLAALLTVWGAVAADARLGDTLADLKKTFGSPVPMTQSRKDQAFWLFEGEDGQLMYSVTFNPQGRSIAEGLKPLKRARFDRNTVLDFIDSELAAIRNSKTKRNLKASEVYQFAGKNYICGDQEYIVIDEPNGFLVIWSQAGVPNVLVLSPEMMAQM
ncbi:MAG: hypothetical protein ABUL61_05495 [Oleiharenicola lentus]